MTDQTYMKLLSNALDAYSLRQKATSMNVANMDTPGYKKVSVSFEKELREVQGQALQTRELAGVKPQLEQGEQAPNLEEEMMEMSDTQMRVHLVTRALRHKFSLIKTGISGTTQ